MHVFLKYCFNRYSYPYDAGGACVFVKAYIYLMPCLYQLRA